ncbi:LacI family DNA-binding transcriptional regulator [Thalassotalea litorea]|uniref:LacI family DNA-binding transcriptional regulator n=1 Tax=Thalassotalea litorea TaxID=2020715 RepID=UPI003736C030
MPTIKDVARLANVSTATVSRVVNTPEHVTLETKLKVQQAIVDLKYIPNANARQLVKDDKVMIGVVLSELSDPFNATIVHEVEHFARQLGIQVLVSTGCSNKNKETQAIRRLQADGCNSVIIYSVALSDPELLQLSKEVKGLIVLNRYISDIASRCLSFDNQAGAALVTEYLLSNGHQNIAIVSANNKPVDAQKRLNGIKSTFEKHRRKLNKANIEYGESNFWGGYSCAEQLLRKSQTYSAVICFNDSMAIGVIAKLRQAGISIPQQISVVGFDDLLIAQKCEPPLTTIHYPVNIMARKAVEVAWNIISQQNSLNESGYQYFPVLKLRSSTQTIVSPQ